MLRDEQEINEWISLQQGKVIMPLTDEILFQLSYFLQRRADSNSKRFGADIIARRIDNQ